MKNFSGGQKMEKLASKLGVISFNPNKIIFRGNFGRGIDCAHRKILKIFPGVKKWKNFGKICAQSIPRIKLPLKGHLLKKFFCLTTVWFGVGEGANSSKKLTRETKDPFVEVN